jgi:hypothetical protein
MAGQNDPQRGPHQNEVPRDSYDDAEAQLGGADSVEKTTYVTGQGTSPEARSTPGVPAARVPSRGVWGMTTWIVIAIIVLVVVGYLAGIGRG